MLVEEPFRSKERAEAKVPGLTSRKLELQRTFQQVVLLSGVFSNQRTARQQYKLNEKNIGDRFNERRRGSHIINMLRATTLVLFHTLETNVYNQL